MRPSGFDHFFPLRDAEHGKVRDGVKRRNDLNDQTIPAARIDFSNRSIGGAHLSCAAFGSPKLPSCRPFRAIAVP
jgi:hypothetical protein